MSDKILFDGLVPEVSRDYRVTARDGVLNIYRRFDAPSGTVCTSLYEACYGRECDWHLEGTVAAGANDWQKVLRCHVMQGGRGLVYVGGEG